MTATISKVKTIAEDLNLPEATVAMVLYDYLAWCLQEMLIDGECKTIFGNLKLDSNNRLSLESDKFGLISLLDKKDIKIIQKIVEFSTDAKIFEGMSP